MTSVLTSLLSVSLSLTSCDVEQIYHQEKSTMVSMILSSVIIFLIVASCVPVPRVRGIVIRVTEDIANDEVNLDVIFVRIFGLDLRIELS